MREKRPLKGKIQYYTVGTGNTADCPTTKHVPTLGIRVIAAVALAGCGVSWRAAGVSISASTPLASRSNLQPALLPSFFPFTKLQLHIPERKIFTYTFWFIPPSPPRTVSFASTVYLFLLSIYPSDPDPPAPC